MKLLSIILLVLSVSTNAQTNLVFETEKPINGIANKQEYLFVDSLKRGLIKDTVWFDYPNMPTLFYNQGDTIYFKKYISEPGILVEKNSDSSWTFYADTLPKCVQPTVSGNFTPILALPANNWSFGILATAHNGEGISSYSYSILTGSGTLMNANSQSASITNLAQGITSVRLIVADSCGSKDSSYILITVNPAPPPTKFTATATATELTSTSIRLTVTTNGGNASYWWSGAGRFSSPASYTTTVTGLQKGKAYSYSVSTTAHSGAYNGQTTSATCSITLK